jgi:hypothetical protein
MAPNRNTSTFGESCDRGGYGQAARKLVRFLSGSDPYIITTLSPIDNEAEAEGLPVLRVMQANCTH